MEGLRFAGRDFGLSDHGEFGLFTHADKVA
jgi:hypothetical protein